MVGIECRQECGVGSNVDFDDRFCKFMFIDFFIAFF